MKPRLFWATVQEENGEPKLKFEFARDFKKVLRAWIGKKIMIAISLWGEQRTGGQNSLLWAAYMEAIATHTGHDKNDIHAFIEDKFAERKYVTIGKEARLVMKTCSTLKKDEFSELLDKIELWAIEELDMIFKKPFQENEE